MTSLASGEPAVTATALQGGQHSGGVPRLHTPSPPVLEIAHRPFYMHSAGKTHRLVATNLHVTVAGLRADTARVDVPRECLPFGLLADVVVTPAADSGTCAPELEPVPHVQVQAFMLSGERRSDPVPFGRPVSLTGTTMGNDYDAGNEDLVAVLATTGHNLQHRMVAARGLASLSIHFLSSPPPASIVVTFRGANTLPASVNVTEAAAALAANTGTPRFGFPYIPPRTRACLLAQATGSPSSA